VSTTENQPSPRRRRGRRIAAVVGVVALAVAVPAITTSQQASAANLTPFGSCADVDAWFTDSARDMVGPWGLQYGGRGGGFWTTVADAFGGRDSADESMAGAGTAVAAESAAPLSSGDAVGNGPTGTNLQEAGVDEPDLVKTDGSLLLATSGGTLYVVDVSGDSPRRLASLETGQQMASELLLLGDRVLVIGQSQFAMPMDQGVMRGAAEPLFTDEPVTSEPLPAPDVQKAPAPEPAPMPLPEPLPMPMPVEPPQRPFHAVPTTVLTVVDLADPSDPQVVRTEEIEAGYLSAREHDGAVRVVLSSQPTIGFEQPQPRPDGSVDEDAATARNTEILEAVPAEGWLPSRVERDRDGEVTQRTPVVECQDVSHPTDPAGLGVLTVLTLDATAADVPTVDTDAVTADGSLVYASTDRLYVATTAGGWMGPSDAGTTQLHGFDTSSGTSTDYLASGSVDGYLMGRWAMSAQDGNLRVATTRSSGTGTDAAVTVLAESGAELEQVGQVGGLGKGEQIRAVRWFGDLAVVVTFRQTDPLYTVDLSDPTAPAVMGELKIPGYSAYLHPIGDDMLLGVGQDADPETGATRGAQVSTFDLSDLSAPTQVDVLVYPGGFTEVEHDSRQFSYSPDLRQAVLPVSGERGSSLAAIRVGGDGSLTEVGSWQAGVNLWIQRAVPIGDDRYAAIAETGNGPSLTVLDADLDVVSDLPLR